MNKLYVSTLGLVVAVAAACGNADDSGDHEPAGSSSDYGPMAVIDRDDEYRDESGTQGTLRISDTCVYLESDFADYPVLPVWRSSDVEWIAEPESVKVSAPGALSEGVESLELRDGDFVSLGGSVAILADDAERPPPDDSWIDELEWSWAARPNPECQGDPFIVGSVGTDPIFDESDG